jgi:hypothetical protein
VKPPDTVFGVPLVAAVCPNPTLPIPGLAAGAAEIGHLPAAVAELRAARQQLVAFGVGSRTWELPSPYRDLALPWGERTAGDAPHATADRP